MSQRASIFGPPEGPKGVDVSDFAPKPHVEARPRPDEIDQASRGSRFRSRDPAPLTEVDRQSTKRQPMVYRTGRNVTFSAKTTRETIEQFYAIATDQGWKAGETFEKAVEALQRELTARSLSP
jgi:hypothetical protein